MQVRWQHEASRSLQRDGYAVANLLPQLRHQDQLHSFQNSWDNLIQDPYLPAKFGVRFRRYGRFLYDRAEDKFTPLPSTPYFQSEEVNPVAGGMKREFAPLEGSAAASSILLDILACGARIFPVRQSARWIVNVHFIRIPCSHSEPGCPCPEGIHSDGFEYISIHVMRRKNIIGAETALFDNDRNLLMRRMLDKPLDSVFASDTKVQHYTDPFDLSGDDRGYRDTMLVSYERQHQRPAR